MVWPPQVAAISPPWMLMLQEIAHTSSPSFIPNPDCAASLMSGTPGCGRDQAGLPSEGA
jgi:hypothetical protein